MHAYSFRTEQSIRGRFCKQRLQGQWRWKWTIEKEDFYRGSRVQRSELVPARSLWRVFLLLYCDVKMLSRFWIQLHRWRQQSGRAVTCKYKQINTFMVTSHGCDCIYQSRKYFEMKLIWSNNSPGRHPSAHPTSCSEQGHGLLPLEVAMCVTPHLMFHFIISQRLLWYFCGT